MNTKTSATNEEILKMTIDKWALKDLVLISSSSVNQVFKGVSAIYGTVIMKIVKNRNEFLNEVQALRAFEGDCTCQLFDIDEEQYILLEESVDPGTELAQEEKLEVRLDIFCELFKQLHRQPRKCEEVSFKEAYDYQRESYKGWILKITDYMKTQTSWKEVSAHMDHAKELYIELSAQYPETSLLHGDFHYHNILKGTSGYKIIDPKGVIGNPIFDVSRYILNEYWNVKEASEIDTTIKAVFEIINKALEIPMDVLTKLVYIENAMAISWCVESGMSLEEKDEMLLSLDRTYGYMKME